MSSKVKSMLVKPIIVGLVSALGAKVMNQDYSVTIPYIGTTISGPVFYGLLGTASSLATETVHTWVLPYLPQSASAVKAEAALLSPAIHAALNVGVLTLGYPDLIKHIGWKIPLGLGIGAELVGSYGFDNFVKPMEWMST